MCEENICVLSAGERFAFKGFEWICLDPNHADGGVLAIMSSAYQHKEFKFDRKGNNNYATSTLREMLTDKLLPVLGEDNLRPHVVDLTADNGDDAYGTVTDKVFILSCDEYCKYHKFVPPLPEYMWTCTPWYIKHEDGASYGVIVRNVYTTGSVYDYTANGSNGIAPACVFDSEHLKLRRQAQMVEV